MNPVWVGIAFVSSMVAWMLSGRETENSTKWQWVRAITVLVIALMIFMGTMMFIALSD